MLGIDHDFMCYCLALDPMAKPIMQRRQKLSDEERKVVEEETDKLLKANHIRKIQYPNWLAIVVMVKKASEKWRMGVDFTDLIDACLKDSYPLPCINQLVDNTSGYGLLSFMDAYFEYN